MSASKKASAVQGHTPPKRKQSAGKRVAKTPAKSAAAALRRPWTLPTDEDFSKRTAANCSLNPSEPATSIDDLMRQVSSSLSRILGVCRIVFAADPVTADESVASIADLVGLDKARVSLTQSLLSEFVMAVRRESMSALEPRSVSAACYEAISRYEGSRDSILGVPQHERHPDTLRPEVVAREPMPLVYEVQWKEKAIECDKRATAMTEAWKATQLRHDAAHLRLLASGELTEAGLSDIASRWTTEKAEQLGAARRELAAALARWVLPEMERIVNNLGIEPDVARDALAKRGLSGTGLDQVLHALKVLDRYDQNAFISRGDLKGLIGIRSTTVDQHWRKERIKTDRRGGGRELDAVSYRVGYLRDFIMLCWRPQRVARRPRVTDTRT